MGYKKYFEEENIKGYRAIPFWSWNDELEPEELRIQIRWMKRQGFGGYFMHARGGLTTEYLGEKWFECINACLDEGEKQGLESWAYDENGWPSGFVGGKLLLDSNNCDRYITYKIGEYDKNATVSYDISTDKLIRIKNGEELKKSGEFLNIYEHISISTADVLNPDVVDKFLKETHEKYKEKTGENFGKLLKGFFTDEPQYFRWSTPYTIMVKEYFKNVYNVDILDGLGLLFVEKDGYRDFRYKYWKAMQTLFYNNFSKKIYDWCDQNGVKLTGHFVEEGNIRYQMMCCGGIMPNYMYEHIPGMDCLGRHIGSPIPPKQVSSVAVQTGKKKVLTETFALCGWDVEPKELKRIAEWQYVNGVNLMCQHLLPYSEHGQRKRDYPAHFSWVNPWVRKDFKPFNDYFARLGYLIGESREIVNIGYFAPVSSVYFDYKRETIDSPNLYDESYVDNAIKLSKMNIYYHILDESVLEKFVSIENGKLIVGKCAYSVVVFPKTITMGKFCSDLFERFYAEGGKLLFLEDKPTYLEGQKHNYAFNSNITLEEVVNMQQVKVDNYDTEIQSTLREIDGKKFIFAVNLSEEKQNTLTFDGDFISFERLNLENGESEVVDNTITLKPYESAILFLSEKKSKHMQQKEIVKLTAPFEITDISDNYLLLDKMYYSIDGINYSKKLRYMGVFNELLKKRYSGEVYLKFDFEVQKIPNKIAFLSENLHNIYCKINGEDVIFDGESDFDKKIYKADITSKIKIGHNEVVLKINFYESDNVYYVLFGENVTESLKNCLAYDTTIEACYLAGDFGVFATEGCKEEKTKNVYLADDFYIDEKKNVIYDLINDGYPFFAGNVTLRKNFIVNSKNIVLKLDGRFATSYLKINGKNVVKSFFDNEVDISKYVVIGKNVAEITLYSGNRNLLGPHHFLPEEEPLSVGPNTYELTNTWKDGVSSLERANYSFVKFGLFEKK